MLKGRFNYHDLDVLDSPLVSPSPLTSLSGVPGSAIAERIFNDPESWDSEDNDADNSDIFDEFDNQIAWLTEEIDRFVVRAGVERNGPLDALSTPTETDGSITRGVGKKGTRPISLAALLEHPDDFSEEIQLQLSKIIESASLIQPYPRSAGLSAPSTSGSSSILDTPLQVKTASTFANNNSESSSPVSVYSASATLSFLEWYGIYPDTPRLDASGRRPQSKFLTPKTPLLQVPSPRRPLRPSSLLTGPSTVGTPAPKDLGPTDVLEEVKRSLTPKLSQSSPAPESSANDTKRHPSVPVPLKNAHPPMPPVWRSKSQPTMRSSREVSHMRGSSIDQPVRRLPSIPPESDVSRPPTPPQTLPQPQPPAQTQPVTQHQAQTQARALSRTTPPSAPPPSVPPPPVPQPPPVPPVPSRHASPAPRANSTPPQPHSGSRPVSVRASVGGPAGPRTRAKGTTNSVGAAGAMGSLGHRPPVLRL